MNSARAAIYTAIIILCEVIASPVVMAQSSEDLVGIVTAQQIIDHDRIFRIYVNRYEPENEVVDYLQTQKDSLTLNIFFGNWCRESKKYIPGLMKLLQVVDSDLIEVKYIAVDFEKKNPDLFLNEFDIKYIPTVVVLKGNVEIGRIEEKPHQLIETDLVQILKEASRNDD
ncbi:MAG TPA: thioredoxin family protein [Gracilimonas sp.]|uniref:thioredoxin family protein n=1 Tax=Gracilimonas sp. TaxID=1974203 RepID=UPI002D9A7CD9|nr:thioredoxin family protein [Gracilimonas sp.]